MNIIRTTFDNAGELYANLFADWLHINFVVRTILLLFALWLIIFLTAQLFQYVVGPLLVLFYTRTILRVWNFIVIETLQEWIYIRYYSQDKPNFANLYLRLCDKAKKNRQIIQYTKYTGILRRGKVRRVSLTAMIISGVAATLWVGAFGIHQEYAAPAIAILEITEAAEEPTDNPTDNPTEPEPAIQPHTAQLPLVPQTPESPANWAENTLLTLNEQGRNGTRLRNGPGITDYTIIEILWDDDQFVYLNSFVPDSYVVGLYWLHVQTPSGTDGYVSSQLVETPYLGFRVGEE